MRRNKGNDTREMILDTALRLLRRHGGDKLTVVDIAREMGMSHANVYRFFKNKAEILDVITDDWLSKIEAFIEEIAHRPVSAAQRIEAIVMELHRKRRLKLIEDAEVFEMYRQVAEMRPDFQAKRRQKILDMFQRLIVDGIASGEFKPVDSVEAATVLKDATSLFLHPLMIPTAVNEKTDARAQHVVRYIIAGFSANGADPKRKRVARKSS